MEMIDDLYEQLTAKGYTAKKFADFVSVEITDGVKVHLLADGTSQLELGFESHRDLSLDETRALADVLRIFEEELQK